MFKLYAFLMLFIVNCASSGNIIDVFGGKDDFIVQKALKIEVIEQVYPPARLYCIEYYKISDTQNQCIEFVTIENYFIKKYNKKVKILNMSYDYSNKILTVYYEET